MSNGKQLVEVVKRINFFKWKSPKKFQGDMRYEQDQFQV